VIEEQVACLVEAEPPGHASIVGDHRFLATFQGLRAVERDAIVQAAVDLSVEQIRWIFIYLFVLIVSIALHEFGHAYVATKCGDDTPERQGRVTLNPIAHIDPIGTLLLPIVGSIYGAANGTVGGFGWGKPVQWQPHRIKRGMKMSTAQILVSLAGPFMNLFLSVFIALVHIVLVTQDVITVSGDASQILYFASATNMLLLFFNLLPFPPLDGGHVVEQFVPYKHRARFDEIFKYAPFMLLAVLMIPQIRWVFQAPATWCTQRVYALFASLF
jgi:Zn-dependent protease